MTCDLNATKLHMMILIYDIDDALTQRNLEMLFWNHTGWEVEQTHMPRLSCEHRASSAPF